MSALVTTSEKAVVVEIARLRWLLWTSIGLAVAAGGLYWKLPGSNLLEPIKAVLGVLGAAASLCTCVWWLLSKRQLLIGESRVLLVSVRTKRIAGHIPYNQIESVHFHHGEEGDLLYKPGVTIRVRRDRSPETFWPCLLPGETDVIIQDRFVRSPAVLRKMLRTRWRDYVRKRELKESPPGEFSASASVIPARIFAAFSRVMADGRGQCSQAATRATARPAGKASSSRRRVRRVILP
jgi:hypothetical protein